jgi:CRP/FNR family cyclic AMP-dependent transcriptional regulator
MAARNPLALCAHLPVQEVAAGAVLIEEGLRTDRLFVLKQGAFDVVRGGVRVITVTEPGAFVGEISALLGSAPTASVIATQASTVHVVEQASAVVQADPALTFAIAQLLARRVQALTTYLVDIKRQYADTDTHLALMDQVLANLMAMQPGHAPRAGSEREDVPGY